MIEKILEDMYSADNSWNIAILRYFNPVGAHESGLIGEDPQGIPNNLMPFIMKVANKEIPQLNIFGNDYKETEDGTCARDFIHVVDLAIGHIKMLEKLDKENSGIFVYNLGTGKPYTVQQMVDTFKKVNNIDVPYKYAERRDGDLPVLYSDPTKAKQELGWVATRTLEDMCRDSWNYVLKGK
jgi:UDP-glucose 4-epimerase